MIYLSNHATNCKRSYSMLLAKTRPYFYKLALFSSSKFYVPNTGDPEPGRKNVLITAALPYVNNTPHLGNIIGGVLSADVYARYCRMRGYNVMFVCGTDEYGTTTQVKALQEGMSAQKICDKYHELHREVYEWFNIEFDHFGRTSHSLHSEISLQILQKIHENGYTTRRTQKQFYCDHCQKSLADRYVKGECSNCGSSKAKGDQCDDCSTIFKDPIEELRNPRCSVCSNSPSARGSEHLYINLPRITSQLEKWLLTENGMENWSNNAKAVTKAWLTKKLHERCITRDLQWGVPVPVRYFSTSVLKVLYVWFQAPLGYISMTAGAVGQRWRKWWVPQPSNPVELTQFMGKDNIVFHSTMAPATLMATNQAYVRPNRLAVTEYLMYEGGKFSKSNNVGVFGNDCRDTGIDSDVWRYYLLSNRPENFDTEFTWEGLATRNNKDLLNSLGNMANRVLKYTTAKLKGKVPHIDPSIHYTALETSLLDELSQLVGEYCSSMDRVEIKNAALKLLEISHVLNKYLQDSQFWSKANVQKGRNEAVIGVMVRILDLYAILMRPFLPTTSSSLLQMLGAPPSHSSLICDPVQLLHDSLRANTLEQNTSKWGHRTLNQPKLLFQQITEPRVSELAKKYGTNASKH